MYSSGVSPLQIGAVFATQLLGALLLGGIGVCLTGGVGLLGPFGAMFLGGFVAFWGLGTRQSGWPQRPAILRIALASALGFWVLGVLAYGGLSVVAPEQISFSAPMIVVFAPLVALLPAVAALVLTMCAGDAAATALGSYDELRLRQAQASPRQDEHGDWVEEDGTPVDLYDRFSAQTLSRRAPPRPPR